MSQVVFLWSNGTTWMVDWIGLGFPGGPKMPVIPPGNTLNMVGGLAGRTIGWNGDVNNDPFPALLDPNIFFARTVPYPAAAFPPASSLTTGINKVIQAINAIPRGTKFCLGGYSQGAVVMGTVASRGLFPGTSGALSDRQGDFLGGVTMGDPIRPINHVGAGGAFGSFSGQWHSPNQLTGGGGCFPASGAFPRLSSAPDTWLSLAAPGDPITTNGTSGPGADINTLLGLLLGALDLGQYAGAILGAGALATSFFQFLQKMADSNISVADAVGKAFYTVGHGSYPYAQIPGVGLTYYQAAMQHLMNLAAPYASAPSVIQSSPSGSSASTAGWTTSLTAP